MTQLQETKVLMWVNPVWFQDWTLILNETKPLQPYPVGMLRVYCWRWKGALWAGMGKMIDHIFLKRKNMMKINWLLFVSA